MKKLNHNQSGFGAPEIIMLVVIVALLGTVGFMGYKNQHKTTRATPTTTKPATTPMAATPATDPYVGWKSYDNNKYGFSYKYPTTWTIADEGTFNPAQSATKQEFATGLKLTTDAKYNNTVIAEVLSQDLTATTTFYNKYYTQSTSNKVNKQASTLKGKQAVYYDVTNGGSESKLYLFGIGNKTYTFGSVNEELNVQNAADYWQTFQKVYDSLTIK